MGGWDGVVVVGNIMTLSIPPVALERLQTRERERVATAIMTYQTTGGVDASVARPHAIEPFRLAKLPETLL